MTIPDIVIAPATLALTQGVTLFSTFLPKVTEVIDTSDDPLFAQKVRIGEIGAAGLTCAMGVIMSLMVGNWSPFFVSVAISAGLVWFYEYSLNVKVG
jgi:hypothetical protein